MQRRGDDQPTVFTDSGAAERSPSTKHAESGGALPAGIARRTGVVFVHGIGTQAPSETFLDWSGPIVELLTEWRAAEEAAAGSAPAAALVIVLGAAAGLMVWARRPFGPAERPTRSAG